MDKPNFDHITDAQVEALSDAVGYAPGGWDCVNPKELIAACVATVPPPGYRFSERFRWAWLFGRWQVLAKCPHNFWLEHGIGGQMPTRELESMPDFRWGPWCLEPIE